MMGDWTFQAWCNDEHPVAPVKTHGVAIDPERFCSVMGWFLAGVVVVTAMNAARNTMG